MLQRNNSSFLDRPYKRQIDKNDGLIYEKNIIVTIIYVFHFKNMALYNKAIFF